MGTSANAETNDDRGDPFAALGDGHRRQILNMIAAEPRSVGALAEAMPISRPAVSRHLRLLKTAGLVEEEQVGTRRVYRLRDEGVEAVQDYLRSVWGEAAVRFRLLAENTQPGPRRGSAS
jgi:DNA-binding transcriptional ArsR family regulator